MTEFYVNLEPYDVVGHIDKTMQGKISGQKIDRYITGEGKNTVAVLVYEQYYQRVQNRLTLTAIVDKVGGKTHVRLVSSGGGTNVFFKFDRGASGSLENSVERALSPYKIN